MDSSLWDRPSPQLEDTGGQQDRASLKTRSRKQQVHSRIGKVCSRKNLERAWYRVKQNHGNAGIDAVTVEQFALRQGYSLDLGHRKLRDGISRPHPVKRVAIDTSDGGVRKLGRPAVLDRVVQQALVQRMEPIFAPQFLDCSCGYRKGRSPHDAMRKVGQEFQAGNGWIVDADLRASFDTIDHCKLVDMIAEEIRDGRVLKLVGAMLRAGVMDGGSWQPTMTGVSQGGVPVPGGPLST